jgi:lysophosphatidylcholine acyltransferase / lyso-PAF acetyltransferase
LGPGYSEIQKNVEKVPTVVINHTSGIDALVAIDHMNGKVCLLVGDHIKQIPFINFLVLSSGGLFAPRSGTTDAREATVRLLSDYQKEIECGCSTRPQLVIFPEGATSNNKYLLPFKRGAFSSLSPVTPIVLKYTCPTVHISNAVIHEFAILILFCCNLG